MATKSGQLQIRVTPRDKAVLRRRAVVSGQSVSEYVLSRALPLRADEFEGLLEQLTGDADHRYVLAELNDLLTRWSAPELRNGVANARLAGVSAFLQNYVAAMVEHACHRCAIAAPSWARQVAPLAQPYFATSLKNLRLHLLRTSPVAFKRRNLFVDSTLGDRV